MYTFISLSLGESSLLTWEKIAQRERSKQRPALGALLAEIDVHDAPARWG